MITVIIPNYNSATFLREAIDSALVQQGVELEVVVVDDGSTDESRQVIESYGDRIKAIFQENQGACAARNAGLAIAGGEWVKFLDADDWLVTDSLQHESQMAERHKHADLAMIVFRDALENRAGQQSPWLGHSVAAGQTLGLVDLVNTTMLTTLPLHLTDTLRAVGGFDATIPAGEDFDLSLRLHLSGARFVYEPGPSFVYRQHDEGTRVSTKRHVAEHFVARLDAYKRNISSARATLRDDLPQDLAEAFGRLIWGTGRFAARCGHSYEARRLFGYARQINGGSIPDPRVPYRSACCLMGAVLTERVLELIRRG